jgi:hypothetical protein
MKIILLISFLCTSFGAFSQDVGSQYYKRVFEARYMDKPPFFSYGKDSLMRFYFNHFNAFDTVLKKAVEKADTAKYIRVYFSFNLDENGYLYEPRFERIASTTSKYTGNAKTIKYFNDLQPILNKAINEMLKLMPQWRPGLESGVPVKTSNYDYFQFWVGLTPPTD